MEPYSVLLAVYRKEKAENLEAAVQSMLRQTVMPDELLLVCDGPLTMELDQAIARLQQTEPRRLRVLRLEQNRGLGAALNAGLQVCRNELIARMDSDDLAEPERMQHQLAALNQRPELSALGGQIAEFQEDAREIAAYRLVPEEEPEIRARIRSRNPMNHVTVVYRKSHILEAGGYPEFTGPGFEDYYLWGKLLARGRLLGNISQVCCRVRVNPQQYERRGGLSYFDNAWQVQRLLRDTKQISLWEYFRNLAVWFVSSVLLPPGLRRSVCVALLREGDLPGRRKSLHLPGEERCHEAAGYQP